MLWVALERVLHLAIDGIEVPCRPLGNIREREAQATSIKFF